MRYKAFSTAATLVLCTAGAGVASTIDIDYTGFTGTSVAINDAPVTPATGSLPTNLYAGALSFTEVSATSVLGDFIAWCLDISTYLNTGVATYETTDTPFDNSYGLSDDEKERVQRLFDANYDDSITTDAVSAAAFQLSLWEVLYDDDWDLSTGSFQGSASASVLTAANGYLDAADDGVIEKQFNLVFLESVDSASDGSNKYQNFVTATPVPLPAAGVLLLAGIAGLGAVKRRRKNA